MDGSDELYGQDGADYITGQAGNDTIRVDLANPNGEHWPDYAYGGSGNDLVIGGAQTSMGGDDPYGGGATMSFMAAVKKIT